MKHRDGAPRCVRDAELPRVDPALGGGRIFPFDLHVRSICLTVSAISMLSMPLFLGIPTREGYFYL